MARRQLGVVPATSRYIGGNEVTIVDASINSENGQSRRTGFRAIR